MEQRTPGLRSQSLDRAFEALRAARAEAEAKGGRSDTLDVVERELNAAQASVRRSDVVLKYAQDAAIYPDQVGRVLTRMLEIAVEEERIAETGSVFLALQADPAILRLVAKIGRDPEIREYTQFQFGQGIAGVAAERGATVRYHHRVDADSPYVPYGAEPQLKSILATPIFHLGGTKGLICLHNQENDAEFGDEQESFMEQLAAAAGVAIAATHSPKTGLPGEDLMAYILGQELSTGARASVAYLDIDNFKSVNTELGHDGGDLVIATVADGLSQFHKSAGIVCHLHGDEFVVLFPAASEEEAAATMDSAREYIASLDSPEISRLTRRAVSITVGIAEWNARETPKELVGRADRALLAAKEAGTPSLTARAKLVTKETYLPYEPSDLRSSDEKQVLAYLDAVGATVRIEAGPLGGADIVARFADGAVWFVEVKNSSLALPSIARLRMRRRLGNVADRIHATPVVAEVDGSDIRWMSAADDRPLKVPSH